METWQNTEDLAFWIWLIVFFFIGIIVLIIIIIRISFKSILQKEKALSTSKIQHQKALLKNSIDIQEKERQRIAADIHDDLIGQVRALMLQSKDAELTTSLQNIITKTRHISHDLSPPLISQLTLYELVQDLFHNLQYNYSIQLINKGEEHLKDAQKLHLYRILKELTNNTIVHAKADAISLQLRHSKNAFIMVYYDNGVGLKTNNTTHLGMKNIEMRSSVIGATHKFKAHFPTGLKLILFLPYE